jgi:hypothetical protein
MQKFSNGKWIVVESIKRGDVYKVTGHSGVFLAISDPELKDGIWHIKSQVTTWESK